MPRPWFAIPCQAREQILNGTWGGPIVRSVWPTQERTPEGVDLPDTEEPGDRTITGLFLVIQKWNTSVRTLLPRRNRFESILVQLIGANSDLHASRDEACP